MSNARKATVTVSYSGSLSSSIVNERIDNFSYSDPAEGQSDTASFQMSNIDGSIFKHFPKRGDKFSCKIKLSDWDSDGDSRTIDCGMFCTDDETFEGYPLSCKISGTSVPEKEAFRVTKRSKTWEDIPIAGIAGEICGRYGLSLTYDAATIQIKSMEQSEEEDSSFLKKVCDDYGLSMKVCFGKVIIYDPVRYEGKGSVKTFDIKDFADGWSYNCTMVGVYTGATIKYTNGEDDTEYTCQVAGGSRIFAISSKVDSLGEAKIKAAAQVNKENRSEETFSGTLRGMPGIFSTKNFTLTGVPAPISGKYFIDKATHDISSGGAYVIKIEAHKVQKAIT